MLDLSHIPSQQQSTYIFYPIGDWQTFTKPRNAKFIQIFCLGSGGGGAGGSFTATTTARGGSGGGGSGGIVRGIIPAFLLPDIIYIDVASKGLGGTSGALGTTGGISYVALAPRVLEETLICKSSNAAAGRGVVASTAAGGAGGAAATVASTTTTAFGNLGLFTAIAGVIGLAGGSSTTAGISTTALATNLTTGGAGGAGKATSTFNGGSILPAPVLLTSTVNGGIANGGDGDSGYGTLQPFCSTGGAGGGSVNTSGTGGAAGNAYYGSGGGGGACGVSAGGRGGDGGDGLVIITVIS